MSEKKKVGEKDRRRRETVRKRLSLCAQGGSDGGVLGSIYISDQIRFN